MDAFSYELKNNVLNAVPEPMVSIRTSAYNHGKYIRECIESIVNQKTNFRFEYIIGEDFSTDGTREIVFEYAEKYPDIIRVITADRNLGMKMNGQRCIEACRGKYIAICEGDDYWIDPYKLQKQVDYMEAHPECSVCATEGYCLNQATGEMRELPSLGLESYAPRDFLRDNQIYTLTTLTRACWAHEFYTEIEPIAPRFLMGDYPLWLYMLTRGPICKLPDKCAVYRELSDSASHYKDPYKQLRFAVSSFDLRVFYNRLYRFSISSMLAKKFRNIYGWCKHLAHANNLNRYRVLFEGLRLCIVEAAPRPSKKLRKAFKQLQDKSVRN
jgi:glycosyltransferase involved in cell wall biosynthesis